MLGADVSVEEPWDQYFLPPSNEHAVAGEPLIKRKVQTFAVCFVERFQPSYCSRSRGDRLCGARLQPT
jgi:hypothetical protein